MFWSNKFIFFFFLLLVDFTNACDYIDRSALYYKLLSRGIDCNLLNVIKSMFSKAECRVKWDLYISEILKSEFGVLQGGMLSPKLFTEFLQDISKSFDQGQGIPVDTLLIVYLLFADDLVFFSDSANGLQKQLTALYKYASLWHIIVSMSAFLKQKFSYLTNAMRQNVTTFTMMIT